MQFSRICSLHYYTHYSVGGITINASTSFGAEEGNSTILDLSLSTFEYERAITFNIVIENGTAGEHSFSSIYIDIVVSSLS